MRIRLFDTINPATGQAVYDRIQAAWAKELKELELLISTDGGDLGTTLMLYDLLAPYEPTTIATGTCFSAGVTLLLVGKHRFATPNTIFYVHHPFPDPQTRDDADDDAKIVGHCRKQVTDLYASRVGGGSYRKALKAAVFGVDKAIEWGFIDGVYQNDKRGLDGN